MRRKDREITDYDQMLRIMAACDCCRLGFHDGESTYIVPLNFGMAQEDGQLVLYFHGASEGKKIDLIRAQPIVGFEMDTGHELVRGADASDFSFRYQSIIGSGQISLLEHPAEKAHALDCIMAHYTTPTQWQYPPELLSRTAAIRLVITEWTCKEH